MLLQERSDRWFRHESISLRKGNVGGCRYPPKMEIGKACLSRMSRNIPSKTLGTLLHVRIVLPILNLNDDLFSSQKNLKAEQIHNHYQKVHKSIF